jgi:hypothetical protein
MVLRKNLLALFILSTVGLTGCAAGPSELSSSPTTDGKAAEGSSSVGQNSTEPTSSQSADPVFVLERYSQIAGRSCQKAMDVGVVEQSADGLVKLIMISKDQAYLGYSAVYIETFGDQDSDQYIELLYDVSYFSSCTDYFDMELAQEAGVDFDYVEIRENLSDSTYEVTREFDGEQYTMRYQVIGGLISSSERVIEDSIELNITYGTTDQEIALIKKAVDDYLEAE